MLYYQRGLLVFKVGAGYSGVKMLPPSQLQISPGTRSQHFKYPTCSLKWKRMQENTRKIATVFNSIHLFVFGSRSLIGCISWSVGATHDCLIASVISAVANLAMILFLNLKSRTLKIIRNIFGGYRFCERELDVTTGAVSDNDTAYFQRC